MDRLRNLEKNCRKTHVEISGIPSTPNEDVETIVQGVGAAIGMEMQQGDVTAAHGNPTYKKDHIPSVVVQIREKSPRDT
ncbi:hypothetical protein J6590_085050 [Homalodisca vitripennis]|nr:hypothetical protein J6590_085050 [Homalodisca vitripennis]